MSRHGNRTNGPPPLDAAALDRLAVAYVGRYATTRARLARYLARKLKERGWAGEGPAPVEAVVGRCASLGYVDDATFAEQRGASLARCGYGAGRVRAALRASGIAEEDAADATRAAEEGALEAALAFARRRRIGPFAEGERPPDQRRRDLGALLRAGHPPDLARRIARAAPGEPLC